MSDVCVWFESDAEKIAMLFECLPASGSVGHITGIHIQ